MAYEKKATSLSDYRPTGNTTHGDLLKLTFEHDEVIYVHHQGFRKFTKKPRWVIHKDFCPPSIYVPPTSGRDWSDDAQDRPFYVPLEIITATVGEQATISVWPRRGLDKSRFNLISIEPCTYQDASRDNLSLAQQLINA